jgi:hypothetical protein
MASRNWAWLSASNAAGFVVVTLAAVDGDFDFAVEHDIEGIGRLALGEERLSGRDADLVDAGGQELELALRAVREQGDRLEPVFFSLHVCSLRYWTSALKHTM